MLSLKEFKEVKIDGSIIMGGGECTGGGFYTTWVETNDVGQHRNHYRSWDSDETNDGITTLYGMGVSEGNWY